MAMLETTIIALILLGIVVYGIWYYFQYLKKSDEYIWVGGGENPIRPAEEGEEKGKEEE
ncbi:hypothetical protein HYS48_01850 [Candidatus Woesearchaeota archaeon]|nr:hypothetical protein [Candidatus Woesearchaeota archaeon]